jgi:hypothetical protein
VATLSDLITRHPGFTDGRLLLAEIYVHQGDLPRAETAPTGTAAGESFAPGPDPVGLSPTKIKPGPALKPDGNAVSFY